MWFFHTDTSAVSGAEQHRLSQLERSPQYKNGKFNNKVEPMNMSAADYVTSTWKFLFGGSNRTPDNNLPFKPVDWAHFNSTDSRQLSATWLGHSSLMINIDGYRILTDPVFEKRISLLGPSRFKGEDPMDIEDLQAIDAVIISHDHYDHLNKFTIQHLHGKTRLFFVPLGVGNLMSEWGVPRNKIIELDWWQEFSVDSKMMIAATPAQHFSGRGIVDRDKTLWASWVIRTPFHTIFFSGDSGYFDGFKRIGDKYGPFDMTFIECGAYNEAWAQVHLFPEQTVQAHMDLRGKVLHPIHWATFNLSLHPWYEPMERLTASAQANNISFVTPVVGETTLYGKLHPAARWWQQAMNQQKTTKLNAKIKP